MKKIYILLGLVVAATSSCSDFLDTQPVQQVSREQLYSTEAGITGALAAVYDQLGTRGLYGDYIFFKNEACTDEGFCNSPTATSGVEVYNFDSTNATNAEMWLELYTGINRANDLIANIDIPKIDEGLRKQILGEALFLRGYYYFMLVVRYGDVPLRLSPTTSPNYASFARTATKDVYAQILKDMTAAEGMVSQTKLSYSSRVYKTVVNGVLARVCLQMAGYPLMDVSKYQDALTYAKKVIDSGTHSLNVNFQTVAPSDRPADYYNVKFPSIAGNTSNNGYRQIFIDAAADVYNTNESMWEVDFKGNRKDGNYTEGGRLGNDIGIPFSAAAGTPIYDLIGPCFGTNVKGTGKLFKSYDATGKDLRRDWVLTTYNITNNTGVRVAIVNNAANQFGRSVGKWRREYEYLSPKNANYTPINFPLLRYADVLLMYAEADNYLNGPTAQAQEYVNQVRRRGYGQTNVTIAYPTSDAATLTAAAGGKAGFLAFIQDERMRELCFEGLRRSDLIRWNIFPQTMKAVADDFTANGGAFAYGALGGKNVYANPVKYLLMPIPNVEMSTNTMIKANNPGY